MYAMARAIVVFFLSLCSQLARAAESSLPECAVSLSTAFTTAKRHV
jgi:hypothetical protein